MDWDLMRSKTSNKLRSVVDSGPQQQARSEDHRMERYLTGGEERRWLHLLPSTSSVCRK